MNRKEDMKICSICKIEKNSNDYYKTSSYCKLCNKEYYKEYNILNKTEKAAYYKEHKNEIAAYQKEYYNKHKAEYEARNKKYRKNDPLKVKARGILNYAVEKGELLRLPCAICGNLKAEAHHEDYTQPLEVIWLCRTHHKARHEEIKINLT